ncbi:MAG: CDP-glycerol glycerophosphotransferase family protein, partial [Mucinivorans sp.]
MSFLHIVSLITPKCIKRYYHVTKIKLIARQFAKQYDKVLLRLKTQDKVKVAFFLIHSSVWKFDCLFKLMQENEKFDPIIIICPYKAYGKDVMLDDMAKCEEMIKKKGYPYLSTYNQEQDSWLDVKNELKPDIVFFTNPYDGLTKEEYYILNYTDSLNCYVTYSSVVFGNLQWELNQPFHNYIWKYFIENDIIKKLANESRTSKIQNCEVTGFPVFDDRSRTEYKTSNVWHHQQKIKIIWAPHHTIEDNPIIHFSTFLAYATPMWELAQQYKDTVQFAFKPHPILRNKLTLLWGKDKTDEYYDMWANGENTQFENGEYIDLFFTSDAMIFDSVSFISEYLYTQKPSLFINVDPTKLVLNEFGRIAISCHEKATNMAQIIAFVDRIIRGDIDPKAGQKKLFYEKYIAQYHTPNASTNILEYLTKTIA